MTPEEIALQLSSIASAKDFASRSQQLVDAWSSAGLGRELVELVLRFMEEHRDLDFGAPGPLVHFIEQFDRRGYEEMLVESLKRRPTAHTVWMLNRVINGARAPDERQRLAEVLRDVKLHPLADEEARRSVDDFLERLN